MTDRGGVGLFVAGEDVDPGPFPMRCMPRNWLWMIGVASLTVFRPALARGGDTVEKLFGLGDLLAAEVFCGLAYDQAAIRDFIDKNVPPDDLNFAGELDIHARLAKSHLPEMSPATKAAYCVQTERVARHYGFVK